MELCNVLGLSGKLIGRNTEEERNKFYCNACDEERDPQLPVYYSAKSRFVAEIKCVFSKVPTYIFFLMEW